MQDIDSFIDGLLQEQDTVGIDQEAIDEIRAEMKTTLIEQIKKEAVLKLDEAKLSELANLTNSRDFTEPRMLEFLQQAGINLNEVAETVKQQYRKFYLGLPEEQ